MHESTQSSPSSTGVTTHARSVQGGDTNHAEHSVDGPPATTAARLLPSSMLTGGTLRSLAAAAGMMTVLGVSPALAQWFSGDATITSAACDVTAATGAQSTAVGSGANATGDSATAYGNAATANGNNATATGRSSFANGSSATATGAVSFANGLQATATGVASIADGLNATATGNNANATGESGLAVGLGYTLTDSWRFNAAFTASPQQSDYGVVARASWTLN